MMSKDGWDLKAKEERRKSISGIIGNKTLTYYDRL